jgi:hypothetical protein
MSFAHMSTGCIGARSQIAMFERSVRIRTEPVMEFLVGLYGYAWHIWDVSFMNEVMRCLIHAIREANWVPNVAHRLQGFFEYAA